MATTAYDETYRCALETIAKNCGPQARKLLAAGHRPPQVVISIAKTSPERQRVGMERGEKPQKK